MLILIKGAGDLASGVGVRLAHCGYPIVMTDLDHPTSIRRTVCFSEAILNGSFTVEDVTAEYADSSEAVDPILKKEHIAVLADPKAACIRSLHPDVVVDAILAKRNLGTKITDAPVVIALGPGFTAGVDCHAVIETMRGHDLGRRSEYRQSGKHQRLYDRTRSARAAGRNICRDPEDRRHREKGRVRCFGGRRMHLRAVRRCDPRAAADRNARF